MCCFVCLLAEVRERSWFGAPFSFPPAGAAMHQQPEGWHRTSVTTTSAMGTSSGIDGQASVFGTVSAVFPGFREFALGSDNQLNSHRQTQIACAASSSSQDRDLLNIRDQVATLPIPQSDDKKRHTADSGGGRSRTECRHEASILACHPAWQPLERMVKDGPVFPDHATRPNAAENQALPVALRSLSGRKPEKVRRTTLVLVL